MKPVAVTLNFAVLPTFTVLFAGWVVIVGDNFTVSFALTLVTLPAIAPGLAAATFFAFLHSFDELVLTLFLSSAELKTLPLMLWGDINYRLNPVLAVVSTLEVLLVVGGLFLARPVLATSQKAT